MAEEEVKEALPKAAEFKEANTKRFELFFPEGRECKIEIVSDSGEATGYGTIEFDGGETVRLVYNRFDNNYTAVVKGKDDVGILEVGGFWYDYKINLTNVEQYSGQKTGSADQQNNDAKEEK